MVDSIVTAIDTTRHIELFDPTKFDLPIHIVGAGATGSFLAFALAKLGLTDINIYDYDIVEEHNIANQIYRLKDIGELKVEALQDIILINTGTKINIDAVKVTRRHMAGVVYIMTDTMASRKEIFENSIYLKNNVKLLIEPRMGIDLARIYAIKPTSLNECNRYMETLYSDDDVVELSACGASQSVITSSLHIASHCVRTMINWFNNGTDLDNEVVVDYTNNQMYTQNY